MPSRLISTALSLVMSMPLCSGGKYSISPDSVGVSPAIDSSSSFWPLPATPAMPRISPPYASKVAWFRVITPSGLTQVTSFM